MVSGYGDAASCRFLSPLGVNLGQPTTAPVACGAGVDGIVALSPSGKIGVIGGNAPNFATTGVGLFNADLSPGPEAVAMPFPGRSVARDAGDHFYGIDANGGAYQYDATAAQTAAYGIPPPVGFYSALAVNPAGTIGYYTILGGPDVFAWNLAGDVSLGTFKTKAGYKVFHNALLCLSNGDLVIGWEKAGNPGILERYNSAGVLQMTYTMPGTRPTPIVLTPGLTTASFWCIYYDASLSTFSGVQYTEYSASADTILNQFPPEDGTFEFDSPMTVLLVDVDVVTGTLIVQKLTSPSGGLDSFDFTAVGVGTPASFSLTDGAQQIFAAVDPDVAHAILETAASGWSTSYASSNGSPHTALVIPAGETVTLVVTNRYTQPTIVYQMRRLRRFQIKYFQNREIFLDRIEFVLQQADALSNGQGSDPKLSFRLSPDGGRTWGPTIFLGLGKTGEYAHRTYFTRVGHGRDLYGEVSWTDPVFNALIDCLIDYNVGRA